MEHHSGLRTGEDPDAESTGTRGAGLPDHREADPYATEPRPFVEEHPADRDHYDSEHYEDL